VQPAFTRNPMAQNRQPGCWDRLHEPGVTTLCIEPGSPWENGQGGLLNGRLRDTLLDRKTESTLAEVQVLVQRWRHGCNTIRPHRAPGCRRVLWHPGG
jgi:hypothetical protein